MNSGIISRNGMTTIDYNINMTLLNTYATYATAYKLNKFIFIYCKI